MDWVAVAAVGVIGVAVACVLRGLDVRLVLLTAALALGAMVGDVAAVVRAFLGTFSNEKFVVPICSAMGFAYVLKLTGCDRHLTRLLLAPVRRVRFLMVPSVVLIGFVVNVPVISQTSTAVCLGTVVVPLMRAAGFSPLAIGSALLLGASVGGELLNPGAPELLTVSAKTGVPTQEMWTDVLPLVLPVLGVSTLVFWGLTVHGERNVSPTTADSGPSTADDASASSEPIRVFKAIVPLIPLALLFLSGPPLDQLTGLHVPRNWLADVGHEKLASSRLIALAMLVGVIVAAVASPGHARGCMKAFFEGAGYGFTHIVSLIVTASCFGTGIEVVGLADHLGNLIVGRPELLVPLAGVVPAAFGFVCGSGMASTQSLYGFFYDPAVSMGADPQAIGAMVSVGSAVGRTMSPVAAVTLMCATLTGVRPFDLVWRVGPPLATGLAAAIVLRVAGLV